MNKNELTKKDFEKVKFDVNEEEKKIKSISYWSDVRNRFFSNKINTVSLIGITLIFALCFIIPLISPLAITGIIEDAIKAPPGPVYWFGANEFGHDVFTLIWKGGQMSFLVGISAAISQVLIGVFVGCIAGYVGGKTDAFIMRAIDVLMGIPYLIIVLLMRIVFGSSVFTVIIAISAIGWLNVARLVRGQVLQLKNEDYVLAAKSMGVSSSSIMMKHLIPNILGIVIVSVTLAIPAAIFSEAFLSFLGLGPSGIVSWGSLIQAGNKVIVRSPLQLIGPAVVMALTMLFIQLIGDALRDSLDPKLRR